MTATKIEVFKEYLKEFKDNNRKRQWNHYYIDFEGKRTFLRERKRKNQ